MKRDHGKDRLREIAASLAAIEAECAKKYPERNPVTTAWMLSLDWNVLQHEATEIRMNRSGRACALRRDRAFFRAL